MCFRQSFSAKSGAGVESTSHKCATPNQATRGNGATANAAVAPQNPTFTAPAGLSNPPPHVCASVQNTTKTRQTPSQPPPPIRTGASDRWRSAPCRHIKPRSTAQSCPNTYAQHTPSTHLPTPYNQSVRGTGWATREIELFERRDVCLDICLSRHIMIDVRLARHLGMPDLCTHAHTHTHTHTHARARTDAQRHA